MIQYLSIIVNERPTQKDQGSLIYAVDKDANIFYFNRNSLGSGERKIKFIFMSSRTQSLKSIHIAGSESRVIKHHVQIRVILCAVLVSS